MTQPAWLYPSGWPYPQTRPWAHRCALEWDRQPYRSGPKSLAWGSLGSCRFPWRSRSHDWTGPQGPVAHQRDCDAICSAGTANGEGARRHTKKPGHAHGPGSSRLDSEDLPLSFRETAYRGARPSGAVAGCAYSDLGGISVEPARAGANGTIGLGREAERTPAGTPMTEKVSGGAVPGLNASRIDASPGPALMPVALETGSA